jgi:hypothetical protein
MSFVINPKTNRPVRVGGKTWMNLVKQGMVADKYNDPVELYDLEEADDADEKINDANKLLPMGQHAVRGRGKHAGKIVKRNKKMTASDMIAYTSKIASRIAPKVYAPFITGEEEDELSNILQNLILKEMVSPFGHSCQKASVEKVKAVTYKVEKSESESSSDDSECSNDDDEGDESSVGFEQECSNDDEGDEGESDEHECSNDDNE